MSLVRSDDVRVQTPTTPQAEDAAEEARETIIRRNLDSVNLIHPDPINASTIMVLNQQPVRKNPQHVGFLYN